MKTQAHRNADWSHLQVLAVPVRKIALLGSALVLLVAGSAKAATFTVNYSGEITGVSDFSLLTDDELERLSEEGPSPTLGSRTVDSPSFQAEQVPKPPSEKTRLEGSYTYTDETNELLSSEFDNAGWSGSSPMV